MLELIPELAVEQILDQLAHLVPLLAFDERFDKSISAALHIEGPALADWPTEKNPAGTPSQNCAATWVNASARIRNKNTRISVPPALSSTSQSKSFSSSLQGAWRNSWRAMMKMQRNRLSLPHAVSVFWELVCLGATAFYLL
jgi:hypothetical protein